MRKVFGLLTVGVALLGMARESKAQGWGECREHEGRGYAGGAVGAMPP